MDLHEFLQAVSPSELEHVAGGYTAGPDGRSCTEHGNDWKHEPPPEPPERDRF
jgi:hypothetical protein